MTELPPRDVLMRQIQKSLEAAKARFENNLDKKEWWKSGKNIKQVSFAESHRLEDEIKKQLSSIGFEI